MIFACLLALAIARPDSGYAIPEHIAILRDDRFQEGGSFNHEFETANGIFISRSGSILEHVEYEPVGQQGNVE